MNYVVECYNPRHQPRTESDKLWSLHQLQSNSKRTQPIPPLKFQQLLHQGYVWLTRDDKNAIVATAFLALLYKPGTKDIFGEISDVVVKKGHMKKATVFVKHASPTPLQSSVAEVMLREIISYARQSLCTHLEPMGLIDAPDKKPADAKLYETLGLNLTQEENGNYRINFPSKKGENARHIASRIPF